MNSFFQNIHPVKDEVLDAYLRHWTEYQVPKKTVMTAPGEVESHMYFVKEGIQKSYYLDNGRPHVIAFAYAPSFSGIPESFFTQTPSKYYLETLTDSYFVRISYEKHQELMQEHREI